MASSSSSLFNISLSSAPRISSVTVPGPSSLHFSPKSLSSAALFPLRSPWRDGDVLLSSSPVEAIGSRLASRRCYSSAGFEATPKEGSEQHPVPAEEKQTTPPSENGVDSNSIPDIKTLLTAYRESINSGNEASASKIQNLLCTLDARRNDLIQESMHLSSEIASLKAKSIRVQADFQNWRKSFEREKLTMTKDVRGDVIESLLAVADSFERVRLQTKKAETDMEKKIEVSYQGIYKQFVEVMKSLQVAVVPSVGKRFDPSVHECVGREESAEFKEGIVMQEIRRGFRLGDRVLRPATVKVSSGLRKKDAVPAAAAAAASEESTEQSLV